MSTSPNMSDGTMSFAIEGGTNVYVRELTINGSLTIHQFAGRQPTPPLPPRPDRSGWVIAWATVGLVVVTLWASVLPIAYPDLRESLRRAAIWRVAGFLASCTSQVAQLPSIREILITPLFMPPIPTVQLCGDGITDPVNEHSVWLVTGIDDLCRISSFAVVDAANSHVMGNRCQGLSEWSQ